MANFLSNSGSRRNCRLMEIRTKNIPAKKKSLSDDSVRCRKHPKHRQSPGVCSLCLNEKLWELSLEYYDSNNAFSGGTDTAAAATTTSKTRSSYSSSSSSSSSDCSSVSSCLSPLHHRFNEVSKKKEMKKHGQRFLSRLIG